MKRSTKRALIKTAVIVSLCPLIIFTGLIALRDKSTIAQTHTITDRIGNQYEIPTTIPDFSEWEAQIFPINNRSDFALLQWTKGKERVTTTIRLDLGSARIDFVFMVYEDSKGNRYRYQFISDGIRRLTSEELQNAVEELLSEKEGIDC